MQIKVEIVRLKPVFLEILHQILGPPKTVATREQVMPDCSKDCGGDSPEEFTKNKKSER